MQSLRKLRKAFGAILTVPASFFFSAGRIHLVDMAERRIGTLAGGRRAHRGMQTRHGVAEAGKYLAPYPTYGILLIYCPLARPVLERASVGKLW